MPLGALAALALLRRWLSEGERAVVYAGLAVGISATASGLIPIYTRTRNGFLRRFCQFKQSVF